MSKDLYYIDYSEDEVVPCGGREDLVLTYKNVMERNGTPIMVYTKKDGMMEDALEFASQARHGAIPYEYLEDDEMKEKIEEVKDV